MECSLCENPAGAKRPLICPSCVRSSLYSLRVGHATNLLKRAELGRKIETAQSLSEKVSNVPVTSKAVAPEALTLQVERMRQDYMDTRSRIECIVEQSELLRIRTDEARAELAKRKTVSAQRTSDLGSLNHDVVPRRLKASEFLEKAAQRTTYKHDKMHAAMMDARAALCREAADAMNLRQKRRKTRTGTAATSYTIAGMTIYDLREIKTAKTERLLVSLSYVARLVVLCCHYLHVRLPAEIILPRQDCLLPMIFDPATSYKMDPREKILPISHSSSPSDSKGNVKAKNHCTPSQPRPLSLDHGVTWQSSEHSKKDRDSYKTLVESATLLAWDIAWLCRSQGVNVTLNSWEDIAPMGRNLWQLLVAQGAATPVSDPVLMLRTASGRERPNEFKSPILGFYSHGTSRCFLGAPEMERYMHSWKLSSAEDVMSKVKAHVFPEENQDWEVVNKAEWKTAASPSLTANRLGSDNGNLRPPQETVAESDNADGLSSEGERKGKQVANANGWMKLRSRND